MTKASNADAMNLIDRLGHALAGTEGRQTNLDSLRTLVQMEVSEWRTEGLNASSSDAQNVNVPYLAKNK